MTEGTAIEAARTGAVMSIEDLDAERAGCRFVWPPLVIAIAGAAIKDAVIKVDLCRDRVTMDDESRNAQKTLPL